MQVLVFENQQKQETALLASLGKR